MAQSFHLKKKHLLLAVLPILLFLIFDWMLKNLGQPDLDVPIEILQDAPAYLESIGRNRFIGIMMLYFAACLIVLGYYCWDVRQHVPRQSWIALAITALLLAVPVFQAVWIHQTAAETASRAYDQVGRDIVSQTMSFGEMQGCLDVEGVVQPDTRVLFWRCGENPVLSMRNNMGDVVNIFTAFVIAALVTGSISTLSSSSMQPREIVLAQMQRRLRIYAELSGIVLTLGMVFTLTWMHWPMPFIADEARSGYTALVNSVLFEFGAFYSLLIVTFYLPVAVIQSHWILKAAQLSIGHTNATPDAVSKWRLQYGLDTSHLKSIRTLLAVSAPSLASLAGGFLT